MEEGDNTQFVFQGPRTGASAENVTRLITGLQTIDERFLFSFVFVAPKFGIS